MSSKPQLYQVIEPYQTPYPNTILFHKGEVVEVGEEYNGDPEWKDWVWCKGQQNNQAWTPRQFLIIEKSTGVFRRDYNAKELTVQVGEQLSIFEVINGFGMAEKEDGERGWVPMKCLSMVKGMVP